MNLSIIERAYFDRELDQISSIPTQLKGIWLLHFAGNLAEADAEYQKMFATDSSLSGDLLEIAKADHLLVRHKLGIPFPEELSAAMFKNRSARIIFLYAKFSSAFWTNHKLALSTLRELLLNSFFSNCRGLWLTTYFLMCHIWNITGKSKFAINGATVSFYFLSRFDLWAKFNQCSVLVGFPYSLFVAGQIRKGKLDSVLRLAEERLPNDPYYQTLWLITAVYGYGYTGNVRKTEIYCNRLALQQSLGKLLRYVPVAKIIRFLPLALRGYGHYFEKEIDELISSHQPENYDPLVNSQFYRASAVIQLLVGKSSKVPPLILSAQNELKKTNSFAAWNRFDNNILQLAQSNRPFDSSRDKLLNEPIEHLVDANLGKLLMEFTRLVPIAVKEGDDWFVEQAIAKTFEHLELEPVYENDKTSNEIVFTDQFFERNVPETRREYVAEMLSILRPIVEIYKRLVTELIEAETIKTTTAKNDLARQVGHDLRTPLSALKMLSQKLSHVAEDRRIMMRTAIKRIEDIASDLLEQRNYKHLDVSTISLSGLLQSVCAEIRASQANKEINLEINIDAVFNVFVSVHETDLKRSLINLTNNAIEAKQSGVVNVKVSAFSNGENCEIHIRDDGPGIPASVLEKLGQEVVTYGKEGGHGLGVFSAFKTLRQCSGDLQFFVGAEGGTTAVVTLPNSTPPEWFLERMKISKDNKIVVVDDEELIHNLWNQKLNFLKPLHFYSTNSFLEWWNKLDKSERQNCFCLVDYDFAGDSSTGLDLIRAANLSGKAALVTGRGHEKSLVERAELLNVKVIDKMLIPLLPIKQIDAV